MSHVPFYSGRRSCIGQFLGEVLVKIVLRTALTCFEIRWDGESERELIPNFTLEIVHAKMEIKPRLL